ncbi:malate dehydrogenase [Handroanthus impetiginosus]|uniref:malate dehydrogenase n=1 Tax=Handroanthus impetiginosus TaxID=429701 RepID=A0A2G9HGA8_9LAMI|nr:malate dehydrogenase [Handroanthus impetiginosus]
MKVAMLRSILRRSTSSSVTTTTSSYLSSRGFSSAPAPERKVAILGAAGGIGQPLSLLMKLNPLVSNLALYDIAATPGVAADVSHINTRSEVRLGKNGVEEVLGLGPLSDYEQQGLEALKPELKSSIEKGIKFAQDS